MRKEDFSKNANRIDHATLIDHSAAVGKTRLLIIDDDVELTRLLSELLEPEGFQVDAYHSGADAAARVASADYALIILDVMLPEVSGFDILRRIRRTSATPVILLTARGDDVDRIVGLEIGADDYLPKPFNPRELTARIRAVLRRVEARNEETRREMLSVGDVGLDVAARVVMRDGEAVELTTVEFDILKLLLESAGQTVSRETIGEKVLGRRMDPFDRSVDMHISKIRRKLGPRVDGRERIKTIRSVGYIYTLPPDGR